MCRLKAEQKSVVEFKNVDLCGKISKEERKREASKPLYLVRYE